MKLVRYGQPGAERPGLIDGDGQLRDLSAHVPDIAGAELDPARLASLAARDLKQLPHVAAPYRLGPCVGNVGKIVCVGINYRALAQHPGVVLPDAPMIFLKAASALCGPDDPLVLPDDDAEVDWEVELGVVIGRTIRQGSPHPAMSHVAGYCIINDMSARRWQFGDAARTPGHNGGQWDKGKNGDGFAPLGPWLVTADEVGDPHALDLWLTVDDTIMQSATTADLHFPVPALIAEISRYMRLDPGDVIATGTPPGSAFLRPAPQPYLRPGQRLRAGISGLGVQSRSVRQAQRLADAPGAQEDKERKVTHALRPH